MSGHSLSERLQQHQTKDPRTTRVLSVQKLEPFQLRQNWMQAFANGAAWLESLGLAHGDLKPENVLLDQHDFAKLADFDCTREIVAEFEACIPPYGRILGSEAGPEKGTAGRLSARTEQFALGSLYYFINNRTEVYDDTEFDEDHGPAVVDRLQQMIFPKLNSNLVLDAIIADCWHDRFTSISMLSDSISERCNIQRYVCPTMSAEEFNSRYKDRMQLLHSGVLKQTLNPQSLDTGRPRP